MNIIVISLPRAIERREKIVSRLAELKIDATIMDAIDAKDLPAAQLDRTIKNTFVKWRDGEKFKPGEIGCLMSHIKAIKLAKENKWENVIILEDDVILSDEFKKGIKFLCRIIPPDWEHIFLGGHIYLSAPPIFQPSIVPVNFKVSGAYSYILRDKIYDKILGELSLMERPVDDVVEMFTWATNRIRSYIFFPFLAYPDISHSYIWEKEDPNNIHPSIKYFKNKLF
jgi:GR25 family glycosyltransferase involved in LPS biosynthesis